MCLDEKTSISSLVIGSLVSIYILYKYPFAQHKMLWALILSWQWALFMQLWEAVAWRNQSNSNNLCALAARGGLVQTVTQPIVFIILLLLVTDVNIENKIWATIILFAYIYWALWNFPDLPKYDCLTPLENCKHLDQPWWRNLIFGAMPYFASILIGGALLVRPYKIALYQLLYFMGTCLISSKLYPCGMGSMWCLFVVFAPMYTLLTYK